MGKRLELPPGGGGGGGNPASIRRSRTVPVSLPGHQKGQVTTSWPDRSRGSARPRRRSGRDQIPTGMLQEAPGEAQTSGSVLPAAAGSGNGGLGDWRGPGWDFCIEPSAIPQFHPSLGHGQSAAGASIALGMSPLGQKLFSPTLCRSWKYREGGGRSPRWSGEHSTLHPLSRARRNYVSINQITPPLPALSVPFQCCQEHSGASGQEGLGEGDGSRRDSRSAAGNGGAGVDPAFF